MGSRALISSLIAVGFFLGAVGFVLLRPLEPGPQTGELVKSTAQLLNELEPRKGIVRRERIRNHGSKLYGLMDMRRAPVGSEMKDSMLGAKLDLQLNALPKHQMDRKLIDAFGDTAEIRFIRFGVSLQLGDFEPIASDQELRDMRLEYSKKLQGANLEVFLKMQDMILRPLKGEAYRSERSAILRLFSDAAVANDFARMMVQDLIVREFNLNPDQEFSKVIAKYEIDSEHPFYGILVRSFNRTPASAGEPLKGRSRAPRSTEPHR